MSSALGITVDDTDSEIRGKLLDHLLGVVGVDRVRLPRIISAKKSQSYIDLRAAYQSQARLSKAKAFNDDEDAA